MNTEQNPNQPTPSDQPASPPSIEERLTAIEQAIQDVHSLGGFDDRLKSLEGRQQEFESETRKVLIDLHGFGHAKSAPDDMPQVTLATAPEEKTTEPYENAQGAVKGTFQK